VPLYCIYCQGLHIPGNNRLSGNWKPQETPIAFLSAEIKRGAGGERRETILAFNLCQLFAAYHHTKMHFDDKQILH
jgi:hypothetical protein